METLKKIKRFLSKNKIRLIVIFALVFTPYKLYISLQIHGYLPGAKTVQLKVYDKWLEDRAKKDVYWISFNEQSIHLPGRHRTNVPASIWHRTSIGRSMDVMKVRGSNDIYIKGGIYESYDNFILDIIFFAITYFVFFVYLFFLYLKRKYTQENPYSIKNENEL